MAPKLPTTFSALTTPFKPSSTCVHQIRHASLLKRPHRPYTFTQLVTLSDGSTYLSRTTSPLPIYRSTKDTRNHPMWQPSLDSLRNVEQDEAGRLKAFRDKFGRGWDAEEGGEEGADGNEVEDGDKEDSLMDLISGAGAGQQEVGSKKVAAEKKEVKMVTVRVDGVLTKVPVKKDKKDKK